MSEVSTNEPNESGVSAAIQWSGYFAIVNSLWLVIAVVAIVGLWIQTRDFSATQTQVLSELKVVSSDVDELSKSAHELTHTTGKIQEWAKDVWKVQDVGPFDLDSIDRLKGTADRSGLLAVVVDIDLSRPNVDFLGTVRGYAGNPPLARVEENVRGAASLDNRDGANISAVSFVIPVRRGEEWSVDIKWSQKLQRSEALRAKAFLMTPGGDLEIPNLE